MSAKGSQWKNHRDTGVKNSKGTGVRCWKCRQLFARECDFLDHIFFGCDGPMPQQPPAETPGKRKGWTTACIRCGEAFDNKHDYFKHIRACKKQKAQAATPEDEEAGDEDELP